MPQTGGAINRSKLAKKRQKYEPPANRSKAKGAPAAIKRAKKAAPALSPSKVPAKRMKKAK